MHIPDDVIAQATELSKQRDDSDYRFIAQWARKEALKEAADDIERQFAQRKTLEMTTPEWLRSRAGEF